MTEKKVVPIEDLVKTAIKDAIAKRANLESASSSTAEEVFALVKTTIVPIPKAKETELKIHQVWASTIFSGYLKLSKGEDFPVSVFPSGHFHDCVAEFIPEISPEYMLDKQNTVDILKAWELKEKVLVHGPTGAGKTSLIKELCAHTKRPFVRINATEDMDSSMIFGNQVAHGGATHWVDGTVTEAVRHGAVFAWDEWDVTPAGIAMGLQWLLEKEGKLFLKEMPGTAKDKFIKAHNDFQIVGIGNTQGQGDATGAHAGTNVQNTATLDRFTTVIYQGYMKETDEVNMLLKQFAGLGKEALGRLVKFATLVRQGYGTGQLAITMSPRSLLAICTKVVLSGYTLADSVALVYYNKLSDSHQKVAKELFRKIYGSATA